MRIRTTPELFKLCKAQYQAAKLVTGEADIHLDVLISMDEYEFYLKVNGGISSISGGSELSAMWGFYEYLARFYGYIWQTPTRTYIGEPKPIRNMSYSWKMPFEMCWFHWQLPNKWSKWLSQFHRYVSRRPHDTFETKCHQKGKNGDHATDWAIIHADKPQIFAKNADGKIIHGQYEKFDYHNEEFIDLVAEQAINYQSEYFSLFPTDGGNWNATAIPWKIPLWTWRGWTDMSDYMLHYYSEIAKRVPYKIFDIYAYGEYADYPAGTKFEGERFNCFFVGQRISKFIEWQETGCKMFWRPNLKCDALAIEANAIEMARQFMRFKEVGMDGFMFDIGGIVMEKMELFVYLISRQIYVTASVDTLVKEFYVTNK